MKIETFLEIAKDFSGEHSADVIIHTGYEEIHYQDGERILSNGELEK